MPVGRLAVPSCPVSEEGDPTGRDDPRVLARTAVREACASDRSLVCDRPAVKCDIHRVRLRFVSVDANRSTSMLGKYGSRRYMCIAGRRDPTPRRSRFSDLWGCVFSTGPSYRGTRAEDATGPRKSRGKKKYLATASRLSPS